nr:biotin/lipoyl-containing protein [Sulfobacillus harzensis]
MDATEPQAPASAPKVADRPAPPPEPKAAPSPVAPRVEAASGKAGGTLVEAPLPGMVLDVKVAAGQSVEEGQVLVILEAMKMENEIIAPRAGAVTQVAVEKGSSVAVGDLLVVLS